MVVREGKGKGQPVGGEKGAYASNLLGRKRKGESCYLRAVYIKREERRGKVGFRRNTFTFIKKKGFLYLSGKKEE